jgi:hypothetical protein
MTPPQPAAVLLLLAAALTLLGSVHSNPTNIAAGVALTRADKCAICEATVHELIDDLVDSKSQPQLDLDLRGRLDPSGKRKGKVLPYHGSDLHMLELLEKVCDRMSDYSRSVSDDIVSLQRHNARTAGGSVTLSNVEVDSKVSEKFKQYCSELVGGNEDEITNLVSAVAKYLRPRTAPTSIRSCAHNLNRSAKRNLSPREF